VVVAEEDVEVLVAVRVECKLHAYLLVEIPPIL
jgi:hypothetical protein